MANVKLFPILDNSTAAMIPAVGKDDSAFFVSASCSALDSNLAGSSAARATEEDLALYDRIGISYGVTALNGVQKSSRICDITEQLHNAFERIDDHAPNGKGTLYVYDIVYGLKGVEWRNSIPALAIQYHTNGKKYRFSYKPVVLQLEAAGMRVIDKGEWSKDNFLLAFVKYIGASGAGCVVQL